MARNNPTNNRNRRGGNDGEEQKKPYNLVPFAAATPDRQQPTGHDSLGDHVSGTIELYLIARTPVQVASGSMDIQRTKSGEEIVAKGSDVARYEEDGTVRTTPILPGSSIKGATRSLAEMISPSCVPVGSGQTRSATPRALSRCTNADNLCPTCRLFGMSGSSNQNYMGQLSVEDAVLVDGGIVLVRTPLLWSPARGRRGLPGRYLRGRDAEGRKLYEHSRPAGGPDARLALRTGSALRTQIHFTDTAPALLGLLISALGLNSRHRFFPKMGAAKPVGMGSVETAVVSVSLNGNVRQSGRMGGGRTVHTFQDPSLATVLQGWTEAAEQEKLVVRKTLQVVAAGLGVSKLKQPPVEGMY